MDKKVVEEIKEEESRAVINCIKDAQRVHPDWSIDDVLDLLMFREETRQVMKRRLGGIGFEVKRVGIAAEMARVLFERRLKELCRRIKLLSR